MVNSYYLKYIIYKNGDTVEDLANHLGITRVTLSAKINNKREFKLSEISRICKRYNMGEKQYTKAFKEHDYESNCEGDC